MFFVFNTAIVWPNDQPAMQDGHEIRDITIAFSCSRRFSLPAKSLAARLGWSLELAKAKELSSTSEVTVQNYASPPLKLKKEQ
jgi:hypothetical protein